ncbi:MAG: hypothetical protein JNM03_09575 [Sphingopyxis sp.]|uniref:hypothetical protein n=1 Tax=Sphingopyxis sp. TaxID=1908224 RepID=UPI001A48477E|nr:hypothetical protein [Sphingopyxis sp.]MBL9070227.1 hypothetical protein [Sphingopyxis sp.]
MKYFVRNIATATITELWVAEANSPEDAIETVVAGHGQFVEHLTIDDETNRAEFEADLVEDYTAADPVAVARMETAAPAMFAALQKAADALTPPRGAEEADALAAIVEAMGKASRGEA